MNFLFLLLASLVSSQTYNCPSTCIAPACRCATTGIPGNIPKEKTPMFVTLTFDDAMQISSYQYWVAFLNSGNNNNGCKRLPATHFISTQYNDFNLNLGAFGAGDEIAAHTVNHPCTASITLILSSTNNKDITMLTAAQINAEVSSSRDILNVFSGIPKNQLIGFRHPFLDFSKATFDVVFGLGFTYESSITLDPISQPYWPFTMNYGIPFNPQPCLNCDGSTFVYPGMWEVPIYRLLNPDTTIYTTMDPPFVPGTPETYDAALAALKYSFQLHYDQKLPFGIYQHAAQLILDPDTKLQVLKTFVQWTLTFKDVWYVTNQQLLDWVQNPVSTDSFTIPCVLPAVDPSNVEICDGIDNDGDGTVDNGLVANCLIGNDSFSTCFGCPTVTPNISLAVPPRGARLTVPDGGCPDNGIWDPTGGSCKTLKRPVPIIKLNNGTSGSSTTQTSAGTSSIVASLSTLSFMTVLVYLAL